jgi:hypothetical protein
LRPRQSSNLETGLMVKRGRSKWASKPMRLLNVGIITNQKNVIIAKLKK